MWSLPSDEEELLQSDLFRRMQSEKFRGPEAKKLKDLKNDDGSKPYKECKTWADFYLKVQEQRKFFERGGGFDT